jgi:hypothetical protein
LALCLCGLRFGTGGSDSPSRAAHTVSSLTLPRGALLKRKGSSGRPLRSLALVPLATLFHLRLRGWGRIKRKCLATLLRARGPITAGQTAPIGTPPVEHFVFYRVRQRDWFFSVATRAGRIKKAPVDAQNRGLHRRVQQEKDPFDLGSTLAGALSFLYGNTATPIRRPRCDTLAPGSS